MASIFKSSKRHEEKPDQPPCRLNGIAPLHVPAPVKKVGKEINGTDFDYDELERLKGVYQQLVTGGYIENDLSDVRQAIDRSREAYDKLTAEGGFEIKHLSAYNEDCIVIEHPLKIIEGNMWYEYGAALKLPIIEQKAVISGLWLLWKMGFNKITETYHWEMFEGADYDYDPDDDDEDGTKHNQTRNENIAFYQKDPIKLKWHSEEFHMCCKCDTVLGDWLRCCWHYRKFDWRNLDAMVMEDDDGGEHGPGIWESNLIIYDFDDHLSNYAYRNYDSEASNFGTVGLSDYRIVTANAVEHEVLYTEEEREKLTRDFDKLWTFDIEKLDYITTWSWGGYGQDRIANPKPVINFNEYDYPDRKLLRKGAANDLRRKSKQRVRGTAKRKRAGRPRKLLSIIH